MDAQTPYTPGPEDNLLGLTRREEVDLEEFKGFVNALDLIMNLEVEEPYSNSTLCQAHRTALGNLYEWAGKWRSINLVVGMHEAPDYGRIPNLMAQFEDELNYRIIQIRSKTELANVIAWAHHRLVWIHPFVNGNGRTARLLNTWLAAKFGYFLGTKPTLSIRSDQQAYISALRAADGGNYVPIQHIIFAQLDTAPLKPNLE